jgi:hypothetical protein
MQTVNWTPLTSDVLLTAIVSLGSGFLGALIGAFAVWRTQTRAIRYHERSIALALLDDLQRMELTIPPLEAADNRATYDADSPPGLHPWVQPLIVDLAARDAHIVGAFMTLEAMLEHNRRAAESSGSHERMFRGHGEEVDRQRRDSQDQNKVALRQAIREQLAKAEAVLRGYETEWKQSIAAWHASDTQLRLAFADLRDRLTAIAGSPLPRGPIPVVPRWGTGSAP